ncbi:hypothetical protein GCM10022221_68740 [Actinocorallia aurea]
MPAELPDDVLVDADPLPRIITYLNGHAALTARLGGPGRVSALNKPPYPCIRLTHTGGDDGDLTWLLHADIQLEVLADLSGKPGRGELRTILYTALRALRTLPDEPRPPDAPVITNVRSVRGGGWIPEPTGQGRYIGTVRVSAHPPN